MKIVFLVTSAFDLLGGLHSFNRTFIRALDELAAAHGWQVEILSLADGPLRSDCAATYLPTGHSKFRGFRFQRAAFAAAAFAASARADRIFFGHVNFAGLAATMPSRASKSLIVHGVEVWTHLSRWQRAGIARMREILSVSAYTVRTLVEFNGMPPVHFYVFPNALDPRYPYCEPRSVARRDAGGPIMLTVTRLDHYDEYKRVDLLIQSMPRIAQQVPGAHLVIVGDGSDRPRLEQVARDLNVAAQVTFAGRVDDEDLASYYHGCDVFVLPSLKEGFGIVFLEAMYYHKACVGVRAGAVDEVIEDGVTGLLAEPNDLESLARCAVRLLNCPSEAAEMGDAGHARLVREFSYSAFRQRLASILGVDADG